MRVEHLCHSSQARIVDFQGDRAVYRAERVADRRRQPFFRGVQRMREVHVEHRAVCGAVRKAETEGKHLWAPEIGDADSSARCKMRAFL